jgi:hypothetical protein
VTRSILCRFGEQTAPWVDSTCCDHGSDTVPAGGWAYPMKHTALLLWGLLLLPYAVRADQTSVSVCVEALEQLKTLHLAAPVYKLMGGQDRQYLADADRPAEVNRLKGIVAESCSEEPEARRGEESEAERLHIARSPGCMGDRETLSTMEKPESRTPEDDIARHRKRVAARCPDVDLSNVWLILGVPVT